MADISFYKYLETAFRHKLFKDTKATSFNYLGYNLPYETIGAKKGIFEYARRVLPSFYSLYFPDTEEGHLQMARDFLQKLDRRLDPELDKYFDPAQAPAEYGQVITQAKQQSQAESGPIPAGQPGGMVGMPGLPSGPSISSMPRRIYRIPPAPEQPKPEIAIANKSGTVTGERLITPTSAAQRFNFAGFKIPNSVKNFSSSAQRFTKANLGRIGRGLGGIAGAGGRTLGGFGLRAIDATAAISQRASTGSLIKGPPKKFFLGILILIFLTALFINISSSTQTQPPPSAIIPPPLDYTLPLRDTSVVPQDIRAAILQRWPNAQIDNWQIIIDQAIAHGWNPAVLLTLWIEESGAQGEAIYDDPLGCDVGTPTQEIQISLDCFFNSFDDRFTNDQFKQFMITYSAPNDPYPFYSNPNFPKTFKEFYSMLVPEGAYGAIEPIITPPPGVAASCPVPGGRITLPSYNADPQRGHCSPTTYGFNCNCGTSGRRAKAIDVESTGKDVILPTVNGQTVSWKLIIRGYGGIGQSEGGGLGHMFESEVDGTKWYFDVLHMEQTNLSPGGSYPSGTVIGRSIGEIIHTTIGTNIANPLSPGSTSTDCDPGWMPTDPICQ